MLLENVKSIFGQAVKHKNHAPCENGLDPASICNRTLQNG